MLTYIGKFLLLLLLVEMNLAKTGRIWQKLVEIIRILQGIVRIGRIRQNLVEFGSPHLRTDEGERGGGEKEKFRHV